MSVAVGKCRERDRSPRDVALAESEVSRSFTRYGMGNGMLSFAVHQQEPAASSQQPTPATDIS
jgi:hypothetical protein